MTSVQSSRRLVLVGNPGEVHVGAHFRHAAHALGLDVHVCDPTDAFDAPLWRRRLDWWARGHRPARLREFSDAVVEAVERVKPDVVLTTGIAPVDREALAAIGRIGAARVNFLTDDPWNPHHRAAWFMTALPHYDHVLSPRHANLEDLAALGGPAVGYLPFAYAPEVHFPELPATEAERLAYDADVMFAGGADPDRQKMLLAFARAGRRVALYGGYWDRNSATRPFARGMLDASGLRRATGAARLCLCLVRRANRDGHSMRTFEVPAMGGCVLAEDTDDHRALFGVEGECVVYFRTAEEGVEQARRLLADQQARARLASASHRVITTGAHTYADRLSSILDVVSHEDCDRRSRPLSRV